jgi:hypothetical protein
MLRYRRVALFLFAVSLFYSGICLLIVYKISAVASKNNSTLYALVREWMTHVDISKQYPGYSVLGFDLLSKFANNVVIGSFLTLFGWLMWKWAKFYEAMRAALHATIAEASDQTELGSAQPVAAPDGPRPPVS